MESAHNSMEVEVEEKVFPNVSHNEENLIVDKPELAPVIIEELDETAIHDMDVDIGEFVEAKALNYQVILEKGNRNLGPVEPPSINEDVVDTTDAEIVEEQETESSREDQLTQQFLNGELTFTEYSLKMDNNRVVFDELTDNTTGRKRKERKPTRQRRKLPPALLGLMGEANLRFAKGEPELAAQMCMEIIRQVPCAPEPFQTLTMIYENDQPDKSLQFALIAAHLSPKDADQWIRLANLSLEAKNIKQAITCYSKAIQASSRDVSLYEARAKLQEQQGDKRAFLKNFTKLIHQLGPEDGKSIIMFAKMLAKRYTQEKNLEQALDAMEQIFNKCSHLVTLEEVHLMIELLIEMKNFHRCLDILTKYTSISIKYKDELSQESGMLSELFPTTKDIENCDIPDDVPVELKVKCLIILVELDEIEIADQLLPKLCAKDDPELWGDLFLDIAEALMRKKEFRRALILLEPLVNSKNFSMAAVWLRHAQCWEGCNDLKRAIKSFEKVLELQPMHAGVRLQLTKLYKLGGQFNKAIDILKQNPETDDLDPSVLYERTLLLFKVRKFDEYFKSGLLLFSRHCTTLRSRSEMTGLSKATNIRQRLEALQLHRLSRGETIEDENTPTFVASDKPSLKSEFALFLQMCKLAQKLKKFGLFQRICFTALTSKRFEKRNSHVMFLCLVACIHNGDSYHGYNVVRELVRVHQRANYWNLLNIIIQRAEDSRHNRFIMRLLGREDVLSYLHILHANNCLVSGTYKYALNDYISLFKIEPNALLALLVAVTLLQMACQKFFAKKNQLVAQALAFLKKYAQLRGKVGEQETNFNIARAFHQLGLLPAAVHYYKLVLSLTPSEMVQQHCHLLDLRKEAAFNLHLIYMNSENYHLARIYLDEKMSRLGAKIEFRTLCEVLENILKLKGPKQKFEELRKFLQNCRELGSKLKSENEDADISLYPIVRLLLPELERDRRPHGLKEKSLMGLYTRMFCLEKDTLYRRNQPRSEYRQEDFADRVYFAVQNQLKNNMSSLSVEEFNEFLDSVAEKTSTNQRKDAVFLTIAKKLSAFEFKWLTKIILKDLKLGIGKKKIFEALHPNAEKLYNVSTDLHEVCDRLNICSIIEKPQIKLFFHIKPMLLEHLKIENVENLFRDESQEYFLQIKYDGERSQIHMKDGKFKYFTRNGHDITGKPAYGESSNSGGLLTPNIARLLNKDCRSIILDGELMVWHKGKRKFGSQGMAVDVKNLTAKSAHQPCFVAYDLLLYNDQLLVDALYSTRWNMLEKIFNEEEGIMIKANTKSVSTSKQIFEFFNESLDNNEEGIVVKKSVALYKPNVREGSGCYKIKAEFSDDLIQDMDLIVLGAYYGDGKSSGKLTSFLVGVADQPVKEGDTMTKFHSVVSVASGLNFKQLNELRKMFELHWQSKCPEGVAGPKKNPPTIWIKPVNSIILQLRATEIIKSTVYPLGYSLRFPRVVAVRNDKPWYSACTTAEFLSFVKDTSAVQKLTKNRLTTSNIKTVEPKKLPRQSVQSSKNVDDQFKGVRKLGIIRLTRLLERKEFCVVNGDKELSRDDIEKILYEHAADVVQNPTKETFCVIIGNPETYKAKNVIKSGLYDIATVSWLKRVTEKQNWAKLKTWYPWELLSSRPSTKHQISQLYDEFYDSFTEEADEDMFKRTLEKSEEAVKDQHFSVDDFKDMDKTLFEVDVSPYSIFRGIIGYFHNPEDIEKFAFQFMAGSILTDINEHITHIYVQENNSNICKHYKDLVASLKPEIKIVNSRWISDCFKERTLLEVDKYVVKIIS